MKIPIAAFMLIAILMPARADAPAAPGARGLIDAPFDYDGKRIEFEGEAIGDPMRRGGWAWVNVLDGYAAIGVFMPATAMETISAYGSGKGKGDLIRVRGVFHRACPDHGGDMDIHAESIDLLERGRPIPRPVDPFYLPAIPVSFVTAALSFLLWRKRKAARETGVEDLNRDRDRSSRP